MNPIEIISKLRSIARPILETAGEKESFPVRFTFRLVLERLEINLSSLGILVESDLLRHNHSIGLICRNILSDMITTGYLIKLSTSEENLYERLYSLYHSDLKRTDSLIRLYQEADVLSAEEALAYREKHAMPNTMYRAIREYVEEYKPNPFPGTTLAIKQLLALKKNDAWTIELKHSFDIWTFYSKYEHLGWYAFEWTRPLERTKVELRLKSVLRLAALLQSSCLEMLDKKEALSESMALYGELYTDTIKAFAE